MAANEAEFLVVRANLMTLDRARPGGSVMAVRGGRIAYVGDDVAAAGRTVAEGAPRVDLGGRTVTPGFIDSHIHLLWYGSQLLMQADLVGTRDVDDLQARLSAIASRSASGWIQGHGFDQSKMPGGRFPTRDDLDKVSATRPIVVSRICGHAAVVNSAALALVSAQERARGDEHAGLYTEGDISPFYQKIPPLTEQQMEESVLAAGAVALATGITSVHTLLDTPEQMIGYSRLARAGKLPLRVVGIPPYSAVESLHRLGVRTGFGDEWLKFGACKFFSDGSLGAQTALLAEPYADLPQTQGLRMYEPQDLKQKCADAQAKGWQLAVHAIGDQAVRETLDAIEYALGGDDNRAHRHRIEHVSMAAPDCMDRLAARKIVSTLQPQFVTSDTWTPDRVGPGRVGWCYPFRTLVERGVPVTLSSDCPVEKFDAFAALASATGGHPWRPGQTLSIRQAIEAYCMGSAYAGFQEAYVGSLEVGKCADFVVLSDDPTKLSPDGIGRMRAERVFVGGREVAR